MYLACLWGVLPEAFEVFIKSMEQPTCWCNRKQVYFTNLTDKYKGVLNTHHPSWSPLAIPEDKKFLSTLPWSNRPTQTGFFKLFLMACGPTEHSPAFLELTDWISGTRSILPTVPFQAVHNFSQLMWGTLTHTWLVCSLVSGTHLDLSVMRQLELWPLCLHLENRARCKNSL